MLDDALVARYLDRLRLDRCAPSVEGLFALQRAHVERIPYETTWIHLEERWTVDRAASVERIAISGRGGYCFHLNGALSLLLDALGYDVSLHVGGVHGADGPAAEQMDNHLVLVVHELATDDNPSGDWYLDTGLGDGLHDPLPMLSGTYPQGPFAYGLSRLDGAVGDWELTHDPRGSFVGMAFRAEPTTIDRFVARNEFLSTSPDSSFARLVTAQRRDASGVDIMRGLVLSRIGGAEPPSPITLTARDDWFDALRDVFDLRLDDVSGEALGRLWQRVAATHEAWQTHQS